MLGTLASLKSLVRLVKLLELSSLKLKIWCDGCLNLEIQQALEMKEQETDALCCLYVVEEVQNVQDARKILHFQ
ncbi:hypothetical protein Tco_0212488 [Tanacetum coccineum]